MKYSQHNFEYDYYCQNVLQFMIIIVRTYYINYWNNTSTNDHSQWQSEMFIAHYITGSCSENHITGSCTQTNTNIKKLFIHL